MYLWEWASFLRSSTPIFSLLHKPRLGIYNMLVAFDVIVSLFLEPRECGRHSKKVPKCVHNDKRFKLHLLKLVSSMHFPFVFQPGTDRQRAFVPHAGLFVASSEPPFWRLSCSWHEHISLSWLTEFLSVTQKKKIERREIFSFELKWESVWQWKIIADAKIENFKISIYIEIYNEILNDVARQKMKRSLSRYRFSFVVIFFFLRVDLFSRPIPFIS